MNIAHLTYDMRIGGTEQVIVSLIQGMRDTSITHSIICIAAPLGPFAEQLQSQGINITGFARKEGFDWRLINQIRQHVQTEAIDILHCHQYTPWSYGVLATIGLPTNVIFTEHGRFYPDIASAKRRVINPVLSLFTDKITAISKATKHALTEFEYLPSQRIEVIYNGIKPLTISIDEQAQIAALKHSLAIAPGDHVLGTIARFDPIKNHELMIQACAELNQQGHPTTLVLVGDGPNRANIEACIVRCNISDKVILTGYQTIPRLFFGLFDVFLLTSFSEGTSMTLLEALSLHKPVIVTNVGGNPEIVRNKIDGAIIANDDLSALVQAILSMNTGALPPDLTPDLTTNFTVAQMTRSYRKLYQSLCPASTNECLDEH